MTPERYRDLKEHFHALSDLSADERPRYLATVSDPTMRMEIESLLANTDPGFLESPLIGTIEPPRVGAYLIERELGRGGMGVVYLARRDDEEFDQRVALKLIKRGIDTDAILGRFRRERQILATLEHPNIARLLDGGATTDGRPYFVMEYVEGERIDAYCRAHNLSLPEIIRLFLQVCSAVQYAHQQLVIHRDLKPGNVIVTGNGVPKLLDFGIAKALVEEGQTDVTALTHADNRPLTPDYASPEQLRGEPMGAASDVYSLGVVLFEMLTAELPFDFKGRSAAERAIAISTTEPRRPSDVVAGSATTVSMRALAGDVDNILLMALQRDPARRYPSVAELAGDLERYLGGYPVRARPDTLSYRLGKFARRNQARLVFGAALAVALAAGLVATTYEAERARVAQGRAERVSMQARRMASSLVFNVYDAIEHLPGSSEARTTIVQRAVRYFDALAVESADDPQVQRELALAYVRLAVVFGSTGLGDYPRQRSALDKAVAIQQKLVRQRPDDLDLQNELAASYDLLIESGGPAAVEAALRNVGVRERIVARRPHDLAARRALSVAYQATAVQLGSPYSNSLSQPLRAIPYGERAVAIRDSIMREAPREVASYIDLGNSQSELAAILWAANRIGDAYKWQTKAIATYKQGMVVAPGDAALQREFGGALIRHVRYLEALEKPADAAATIAEAVAIYEKIAPGDAKNSLLQGERVSALTAQARVLRKSGHLNEALATSIRVLQLIDAAAFMHVREVRRGRALLEYAAALEASKAYAAAESRVRDAVKLLETGIDHRAVDAYVLLGDVLHDRGDNAKARAAYGDALRIGASRASNALVRAKLDEANLKLAAMR